MFRGAFVVFVCLTVGIRPTVASADLIVAGSSSRFAQQLPSALLKFAAQSGAQVTSPGQLAEGRNSAGVVGTFDAREALGRLLTGTDLGFDVVDEQQHCPDRCGDVEDPGFLRQEVETGWVAEGANVNSMRRRRRPRRPGSRDPTTGRHPANLRRHRRRRPISKLEEVVVTANKRAVNIQDLGLSITAIGRDTIQKPSRTWTGDYSSTVPGVMQSDPQHRQQQGGHSRNRCIPDRDATVAVYFGEVPLTSVASL